MRKYETFEDFKKDRVKEPIAAHIVLNWEWKNNEENFEDRNILLKKPQCELVDLSFSMECDEEIINNGKIVRLNIQNESDWDWNEFVKKYREIKYLIVRNSVNIPEIIFEMSGLLYLELYNCKLESLKFDDIICLTELETLSLEKSNICHIPECIFKLQSLQVLSVMHTDVTEIPDEIRNLKNLKYLGLNGTKIDFVSPIIGEIKGLTSLYLGQTNICDFPVEMKNLTKLEHLALWETQLEVLPDWICEYKFLKGLYLGRTKNIRHIPENIGDLVNLKQLYLDGTSLCDLPDSFGRLTMLEDLDLSNTSIHKFPTLNGMVNLIRCNLSNMVLERIPREFIESKMEIGTNNDFANTGLYVENTKLLCQPISLFYHDKDFIIAYYDEKKIHLNETKIVFLGDGEAGKSHIIERIKLDNQLLDEFTEESTPGIAISQKLCQVDGETIRLQIWDFGGQEIMHSMHRFFLTERTLYVIVINARDNTQDERAEYWLNNVKSFANGCPVIIVLNKMDQNPTASINERLLRNDYPQIVQILKMSAMKDSSSVFSNLMKTVVSTIKTFDSYAMDFPISWNKIKTKLTEMDSNYITDLEYRKICCQYSVGDEQIQNWLLDWFHDLGISFNYHKKDQLLGGYMVLKPTWITNAIYIILFNGSSYAQNGIISVDDIIRLLKNPTKSVENIKYNIIEVPYILGVMRRFEISYAVDNKNEFIPMMCDKNQHEEADVFLENNCLEYYMEYEYLPNNVLHKLMIKMQKDLDKKKIWLTGMILSARENNVSALVRMHDKRIEIFIQSLNSGIYPAKDYLSEIRDELLNINKELNLTAEDTIVYKENEMAENIKYNTLLIYLTSKQSEYFSPVFRKLIPIKKILGVVEKEQDTELIINYCKENENATYPIINNMLMNVRTKFDCREFEEDLLECCLKIQGNTLQILKGKENDRNTYFRDMLTINKKYIICDQTLNGISSNGKASGELDILVKNQKQMPITILEALTLTYINKKYISEHIDKLFLYDTWGLHNNYILVYVENDNFVSFKNNYKKYVEEYEYPYLLMDLEERKEYAELAVFDISLLRNEKKCVITHILIHLQGGIDREPF